MPTRSLLQSFSLRRIMMLRLHGVDLFVKAFIFANLLGLILVWNYSQRQEATRRKYEAIITNELANIQGRMSSLQQEAEENHASIGQMKDAIETFIDSDNESHKKLLGILGAAQQELVIRPSKAARTPVMQPGGILPRLDGETDIESPPQQRPQEEIEDAGRELEADEDEGQHGGDILPDVRQGQEDPAEPRLDEDDEDDFQDNR